MNTNLSYPKVLLVGRTNVGKSTIFNRMSEQKRSIVFDREGVTRDYVQELVSWNSKQFLLVDTGGLNFARTHDDINKRVQEKVLDLLSGAALLLFVVDGKNGMTEEDRRSVGILRRTKKPIVLLVNKADNTNALEDHLPEFYGLGIDTVIPVSGIHGIGMATLFNTITQIIPAPEEAEPEVPSYKVVIIGRPNVGKSSLMNLLIQHERSIVSPVAGTTREPISEMTYACNDLIQLTDTAGVRRSRKIDDELEELMIKSSLQAVKQADLVMMMIDASEGKIADQELKLLFYAYEQKKMVVTIFNKTDLLDDYKRYTLEQSIDEYQFILKKLPQLWISCITQKNINKIFDEIQRVHTRCAQIFNEIQVNEAVRKELETMHLYHTTVQLKVSHVKIVKSHIPTFILYVNYPEWFGTSELGCIENILRRHYDLVGCPVQFIVKEAD